MEASSFLVPTGCRTTWFNDDFHVGVRIIEKVGWENVHRNVM